MCAVRQSELSKRLTQVALALYTIPAVPRAVTGYIWLYAFWRHLVANIIIHIFLDSAFNQNTNILFKYMYLYLISNNNLAI